MVKTPYAYPLVIELMKRSRLRWRWVLAIVAALLLVFLILVAYMDGVFTDLSHWGFWRNFLDGPTLIFYILLIYPVLWRLWWRSVQSLQALISVDEGRPKPVLVEGSLINHRWEWVSIIIGALFWLSLWQPWGWDGRWESGAIWLSAYDVVTQIMLFSLLSWLVYSSFTGSRYLSILSRQHLNLDIFDTEILTPVARFSLGFSLAFIGGICLSLVFQTQEDLLMWNNIIVYIVLVCFTVLLFFLSMWSTHGTMAKAKRRELDLAKKHLKEASLELKERVANGSLKGIKELASTVTVLINYERRIKEIPEWPFNSGIIRRLAASILAPITVFLVKVLSHIGISM